MLQFLLGTLEEGLWTLLAFEIQSFLTVSIGRWPTNFIPWKYISNYFYLKIAWDILYHRNKPQSPLAN